jgi:ACS family glucarate transporter-like MFS transporter
MSDTVPSAKGTHVRWKILAMLFAITVINYADRATLSMVGPSMLSELGLNAMSLGIVFSAFGWSYAAGQIPGGWLLDRMGSKRVYGASLFFWSLCTFTMAFVGSLPGTAVVLTLFILRFILGWVESPAFPANARITAAWFPTAERGIATSIFNSAQYAAVVVFAPIMGWIVHSFGWHWVFILMGSLGFFLLIPWIAYMHAPSRHPAVDAVELDHITRGGALVDMDSSKKIVQRVAFSDFMDLLTNRMLVGVYVGQYCITALTYFFITWFPIYLVKGRHMSIMEVGFVAALPAVLGFSGGLLGGMLSDTLLRRGYSVTTARKTPFVLGMALASTLVFSNFVDTTWMIVGFMTLAFFGKGLSAIGWAVISDASPKALTGLTGGIFNGIGNIAGIVTPIVIGSIVQTTGSFDLALWFVAAHCVLAMFAYLVIVGPIERVRLRSELERVDA